MDINEMRYQIVFTPECREEMDNIYNYISKKLYSPNSSRTLMKMVETSIYNLRYMPEKYSTIKKYDELDMQFRRIVIKNYIILYTISEEDKIVNIVHMYYGKSNYLYTE